MAACLISGEMLSVSMPSVRAMRWTSDVLYAGMKEVYAVARVERGRSEWRAGGRSWIAGPGAFQMKQPGDVHRELSKDGPVQYLIVALPDADIARVRAEGSPVTYPQLEAGDERAAPFQRLLDAVAAGADRLSLEVAVAEAVNAYVALEGSAPSYTRPVRRAVEVLHERLADGIGLDELAAFADVDKFHFCRAFRAQVGMPPHTYLTHLRIRRAKQLLDRGVRASEIAPLVGLYDQSQLNRHFRKLVGMTPGRYGKRAIAAS